MPYHACLLLLWNAHINIQYIIFSYWSYCLFIYIMKCEPHGTLNLNKKNVEWLGLQDVSESTTSTYILFHYLLTYFSSRSNTHMFTNTCSSKKCCCEHNYSKHLHMRTKIITRSRILWFHPIDVYMNRPSHFENMTFIEYFTKFEFDKLKRLSSKCHGEDNLKNYIYTTNKLTRFTYFHPTHNIEGFFYNILVQNMCFWRELDLLSASNLQKNYVHEYHFRGLVHDLDKIQMYLMK